MAILTAGALCRDQVKRVVETGASQRLVAMAILDKPKVNSKIVFSRKVGNGSSKIHHLAAN